MLVVVLCVCVFEISGVRARYVRHIWPFSDKNEHSEPLRENEIRTQHTAGLSPV